MNNLLVKNNTNKPSKTLRMILILMVCLIIGKLSVSSFSVYIIGSSSMEPSYPVYSLVITHKGGFERINVGDVIVYKSNALSGKLAFHRVVQKTPEGVYTKGDNNNFWDNQIITSSTYIGKEVFSIKLFARYLQRLKSRGGILLFLFLPALGIYLCYIAYKMLKETKQKE